MNWEEFKKTKEVKHNADVSIDDVILIESPHSPFEYGDKIFERAVVYGYCGKYFNARYEESGRSVGFISNVDLYKVVGKSISV